MSNEYQDWLKEEELEVNTHIEQAYSYFMSIPRVDYPTWRELTSYMFKEGMKYQKEKCE